MYTVDLYGRVRRTGDKRHDDTGDTDEKQHKGQYHINPLDPAICLAGLSLNFAPNLSN